MQAGLSFEQAPPFSVPLRFFVTAPLFLLAGAVLLVLEPETLASRWTLQALALAHALTLGFLATVMLGALMQMLPVVAGAVLPAPRLVAGFTHLPLATGTITLMAGFMGAGAECFGAGIVLLGVSFAMFLAGAGISLARAAGNITVRGIQLALVCLALTVALGLALAGRRAGLWGLPEAQAAAAAHPILGLVGWVLLLVIGVAYKVVPMFQITPSYPPRLSRWLTGTIFILLIIQSGALLLPKTFDRALSVWAEFGLALAMLSFAAVTLHLQSRRRRRLPDITLDFWRAGMGSLIICVAIWLAGQLWPGWAESESYPLLLGAMFGFGFATSVASGMLYKIVPFLAWFHLQAQLQARAGTIPNMKEMIAQSRVRAQFRLHLAACGLLAAATVWPHWLSIPAGIAIGLAALLLEANLISAARRYLRHGGRF
ncbi:MAG TPA: hypothetical protein VEP67_03880 [Thiobacillaceae bacterium]|nr:hypothetical protein [Thiobacillaceae bacterium]